MIEIKTSLTKQIEKDLVEFLYNNKYELAVLECQLGFGGRYGIVDVLSYHGKSIGNGRGKPRTREVTWRCYEIKTSKQDFYSKHKWTFVGHYNYFVMPLELYEIVKEDIPKGIGCYIHNPLTKGFKIAKRASRRKIPMSESEMNHDFLVSSSRDSRRWIRNKK